MEEWKYRSARDLDLPSGEALKSVKREVGLGAAITSSMRWVTVRSYLKVYHRTVSEGRERLPKHFPFVIVANHASHLDALILASQLPMRFNCNLFPIAAGDTFFETKPAAMFASFFINALPLWRKNCGVHTLQILRDRLIEGDCGYIIFPEGTRSRTGSLAKFKPGIGKLVAATSVPVVPCKIFGAFEAFPPTGKLPRPRVLRLKIGSPLTFEGFENNRESWNQIADQLHEAVENL